MTRTQLIASRALWQRRLTYRQKKVDYYRGVAKSGKGDATKGVVTDSEAALIRKWEDLRDEAKVLLSKRETQLNATRPLRVRALEEARKDLDVRETQGNNWGGAVTEMIRDNGGTGPEPWCGDAVAHWYREAGSKVVQRGWASTIWLLANLTPVKEPLAGHVAVFHFGSGGAKHTGLFERWIDRRAGLAYFIEGNTNGTSSASDSGGGEGVYRRVRHVSQVAGFRRVAR